MKEKKKTKKGGQPQTKTSTGGRGPWVESPCLLTLFEERRLSLFRRVWKKERPRRQTGSKGYDVKRVLEVYAPAKKPESGTTGQMSPGRAT